MPVQTPDIDPHNRVQILIQDMALAKVFKQQIYNVTASSRMLELVSKLVGHEHSVAISGRSQFEFNTRAARRYVGTAGMGCRLVLSPRPGLAHATRYVSIPAGEKPSPSVDRDG